MANSRSSGNTDNSSGQDPALNGNEWLGVQRRYPSTTHAHSNTQDVGQFVEQLGPEEPWDGISMIHASHNSAEHWPGQWQYQYQAQDQPYHAGAYVGYQQHQQQDHPSQQQTSTRADQGSLPSQRQREGSSRDKSRRDGKSRKKDSKSNSSRK